MEDLKDQKMVINIYSANGKLMETRKASPITGKIEADFDASNWSKGMYIVAVSSGETQKTSKIILE